MERLTIPDEKIEGGVRRTVIDSREVKKNAMTIYWALKKYEDTGLTPTEIIRKHMNDGWIPVEKELPPLGQSLQATILHHEWVSDYDSSWVPPEEKIHHPEYTEVCEIYSVGAMWYYDCAEDDYHRDVAYIFPLKDLSNPVAEIIAWQPLPEPYRPERSEE